MSKRLAIFDMDGLFIDSERIYAEGWHAGLNYYGIVAPDGFVESLSGQSAKENDLKVAELVQDKDLAKEVRKIREQYYQKKLQNGEVSVKKFAKEIVEHLKIKGFKVILASSSTKQRIDELLMKNSVNNIFDAIVCVDHVKEPKPAPDIYLAALNFFDTKAEQAIAFEDSVIGATAAVSAGVDVCLVNESLDKYDLTIDCRKCLGVFNDLEETYNFLEANQVC